MRVSYVTASLVRRLLGLILVIAITAGHTSETFGQTNAAAQAVRQRVQGLGGSAPDRSTAAPSRDRAPATEQPPTEPSTGNVDLTFVPSDAVGVVVLHPAQFLSTPLGKLLPVEVISAYSTQLTGFDPTIVNEVVAFGHLPEGSPSYGIVAKFDEPFKGSAIPASLRRDARPADLAGRRYLQGAGPEGRSFYGPDSKTLIVAPDATLRSMVEGKDQPKSSPLIDRVRTAAADCDAYVAADVASLQPMLGILQMYAPQLPPEAQRLLEAPNLMSAAELTFSATAPNPITLVVHANDEASAEQLESLINAGIEMLQAHSEAEVASAAADDTIAKAWADYSKRTSGDLAPRREGSKLTFFQTDGDDARERQLVLAAWLGFEVGKVSAAMAGSQQIPDVFPGQPGVEDQPPPTAAGPAVRPVQERERGDNIYDRPRGDNIYDRPQN